MGRLQRRRQADVLLSERLPRPAGVQEQSARTRRKVVTPKRSASWHADRHLPRGRTRPTTTRPQFPRFRARSSPRRRTYKGKQRPANEVGRRTNKAGPTRRSDRGRREMGANCATYVHTELDSAPRTAEVPVAINTERQHAHRMGERPEGSQRRRRRRPSRSPLSLKLKKARRRNAGEDVQRRSAAGVHVRARGAASGGPPGPWFEDVAAAFGLRPNGLRSDVKGRHARGRADFTGDGKPDILYGAERRAARQPRRQVRPEGTTAASAYKEPGKVGPRRVRLRRLTGTWTCSSRRRTGKCEQAATRTTVHPEVHRRDGRAPATWRNPDSVRGVRRVGRSTSTTARPDLIVCSAKGTNRYFKGSNEGQVSPKRPTTPRASAEGVQPRKRPVLLLDLANGDGRHRPRSCEQRGPGVERAVRRQHPSAEAHAGRGRCLTARRH